MSEFVRFQLFSAYRPHYRGTCESLSHNIVRSLDLSIEEILNDFEHKVRKNLKKAVASGLTIEFDPLGARLDDFMRIYYGTMDRASADPKFFFSKAFFETIGEMKGNFMYVHVLHEGEIISTELILHGRDTCYSFLGGTDREYFHLRPNDFLKFETIKWAKSLS